MAVEEKTIVIKINGEPAKSSLNQLYAEAKKIRQALQELSEEDLGTAEAQQLRNEYQKVQEQIQATQRATGLARQETSKFSETLGQITKATFWLAIAQQIYDWAKAFLATTSEVVKLQTEVSKLTGATGTELKNITSGVMALANTFGKDYKEVLLAANNYAKQMGITHREAFAMIEKGFIAGADTGDEFLDKLKEYPIQLKQVGFAQETVIKAMATEAKGGIYSDKFLDSLKEFGLRIREMGKAQQDALSGAFGENFTQKLMTDLDKGAITTETALTRIMQQAEKTGLSVIELQTITTDLFGGAGEDVGGALKVWELYKQTINSTLEPTGELQKQQQQLLEANKELAKAQNELAGYFSNTTNQLSLLVTKGITTALEWFTKLVEVTGLFSKSSVDVTQSVKDEMTSLEQLRFKLISTNQTQEERRKTIEQLQKQYPEYLGNLSSEKATNEQLTEALDKVNNALVTRLILKKNEQVILEQAEKTADKQQKAIEAQLVLEQNLAKFYQQNNRTRKLQEDLQGLDLLTQTNEALTSQNIGISRYNTILVDLQKSLDKYKAAEIALNDEKLKGIDLEQKKAELMKALGVKPTQNADTPPPTIDTQASNAQLESNKKAADESKKLLEQQLNDEKKAAEIREQLRIKAIADETERQQAEMQLRAKKEVEAINQLRISELEKADLRKQVAEQLNADLAALEQKRIDDEYNAKLDALDKLFQLEKDYQDQLNADKLANAQAEVLRAERGGNAENILNAKLAELELQRDLELENLELTEAEKNLIIEKYTNERLDLEKGFTDAKKQLLDQQTADVFGNVAAFANALGQQAGLGKEFIMTAKAINAAQITMASIVEIAEIWKNAQANPLNAIIPGWGTIYAVAATAAAVGRTAAAISNINSVKYQDGGLLAGASHSQGGVPIRLGGGFVEAEGGEMIVNKRATANNLDALSTLNTYGANIKYSLVPQFELGGMLPNTTPSLPNNMVLNQSFDTSAMQNSMKDGFMMLGAKLDSYQDKQVWVAYTDIETVGGKVANVRWND